MGGDRQWPMPFPGKVGDLLSEGVEIPGERGWGGEREDVCPVVSEIGRSPGRYLKTRLDPLQPLLELRPRKV